MDALEVVCLCPEQLLLLNCIVLALMECAHLCIILRLLIALSTIVKALSL